MQPFTTKQPWPSANAVRTLSIFGFRVSTAANVRFQCAANDRSWRVAVIARHREKGVASTLVDSNDLKHDLDE